MPGMDHILSKAYLATGGSVAYLQFQVMQEVAAVGLVPAAVQICPTSGFGSGVIGVVQEPLDATKTATGKAFVNVALQGNTKVIWDGTTSGGSPASIAPALGCYVVPSTTVAGRVRCISSAITSLVGIPVVGQLISLPGSPLPTFGANAAAGDLFDVELLPGERA
jgi:hypothetical protein